MSLFACKNVSFQQPFTVGQEIKVFISKSHATEGSTRARGNGAAIWVESVNNKAFTVCVLEYGDGSSGASQVNWMALQSVPAGAQLGTASLNSWTTGTKCKRIAFEKVRLVQFFILLYFISLVSAPQNPSAFRFTIVFICLFISARVIPEFQLLDAIIESVTCFPVLCHLKFFSVFIIFLKT